MKYDMWLWKLDDKNVAQKKKQERVDQREDMRITDDERWWKMMNDGSGGGCQWLMDA